MKYKTYAAMSHKARTALVMEGAHMLNFLFEVECGFAHRKLPDVKRAAREFYKRWRKICREQADR